MRTTFGLGTRGRGQEGNRIKYLGYGWLLCVVVIGLMMPCTNVAEAQTTLTAEANAKDEIPEVVVTANRRAENLQLVPVAVTAISGDQALGGGVTDTQSLANAVPGLTIDRSTATAIPFIRGVGSTVGQVGSEPSVAFYVDDVYTPAGGAEFANFNNIDRIEVEKGPQGTLFGRNASGGVIQVYTKNPTKDSELDASIGYASYDTKSTSVYINGAFAPTLTGNISFYGSQQDNGWGHNVTTGQSAFQINWDYGGRIKLLWEPTDKTTVLLNLDHDITRSSEGYYRPAPGTVAIGVFGPPPGFYDLLDHTNPYWTNRQSGASVKLTQFVDWARFVSISAYRNTLQEQYFDQAGTSVPVINVGVRGPDATCTQELQLLSLENARITWITGTFFMSDKAGYEPLTLTGPAVAPLSFAESTAIESTKSYAGFAQATTSILPRTNLTAGLRYTRDDRHMSDYYNLGGLITGAAPNNPQSLSSSKVTGKVSLDYQFTDDVMGYIAFNRGFRSAAFNAVVFPGAPIGAPVQPETLDDYSIGEKAEFFDHRLRINAEGFYYKYKNIQIDRIVAGGTEFSNAAAATIKGVDLDVAVIPVEHFTMTAAFEVLDGKYTSYPNGVFWLYSPGCAPASSNCQEVPGPNLAGNKTVDTPPFSFSVTGNYSMPTAVGNFELNLVYNHGGDYFFTADNGKGQINPSVDKQPTLNLLNAALLWSVITGRYDVRLWGKNITGQKYISYGNIQSLLTTWSPAPPATYGITLSAHFH